MYNEYPDLILEGLMYDLNNLDYVSESTNKDGILTKLKIAIKKLVDKIVNFFRKIKNKLFGNKNNLEADKEDIKKSSNTSNNSNTTKNKNDDDYVYGSEDDNDNVVHIILNNEIFYCKMDFKNIKNFIKTCFNNLNHIYELAGNSILEAKKVFDQNQQVSMYIQESLEIFRRFTSTLNDYKSIDIEDYTTLDRIPLTVDAYSNIIEVLELFRDVRVDVLCMEFLKKIDDMENKVSHDKIYLLTTNIKDMLIDVRYVYNAYLNIIEAVLQNCNNVIRKVNNYKKYKVKSPYGSEYSNE